MKGIILAGGSGTRLHPITLSVCKQLLPIYDKPMIYYPLSTLLLAGIRDILVISTPDDTPRFQKLLKDGSEFNAHLSYKVQERPRGIAEAFILGEEFIQDSSVCLILGDNIFHGHQLKTILQSARTRVENEGGGLIFGYPVCDPSRYGVVEFDALHRIISIEEKPISPKSNYAVVGLYLYDNAVVEIAKHLTPSTRGELEITDINKRYFECNKLHLELIGRGFAWLDTGTFDSLLEASNFIKILQERTGLKIGDIYHLE